MATLLLMDLRQALRGLLRTPGFTFFATLSLALGIGLNSAVFTVLDTLLLRPLPVQAPSRLARVYPGPRRDSFSAPTFREFARGQSAIDLAATGFASLSWTQGDQSRRVTGSVVSGGYFPILGIRPALGRLLGPSDDAVPGASPVAVLNHAFWQRELGGDPGVIGRTLTLNGHPFTVVGVAGPGFHGDYTGLVPDLWAPLAMQAQLVPDPARDRLQTVNTSWLQLFGRLRPGVDRAQAQEALRGLEEAAFQRKREPREGHVELTAMTSLPRDFDGLLRTVLPGLQVVVLLVLLIACSNVANLQLARALARRQEVAVRIALGAARGQLVRQFLTESAALALLGAAGGLALGALAMRAVPALIPPMSGPVLVFDLSLDWRVLAFTTAIALLTGLAFGLVPALQASRPDLVEVLKEEAAGLTTRTGFARRAFVVVQVALSLVLLVASGLFLRSLGKARGMDPGFERTRVALFQLEPGTLGYDPARGAAMVDEVRRRCEALPGVRSASFAWGAPLSGDSMMSSYEVQGEVRPKGAEERMADFNGVGAGYFRTLGVPVLEGREFSEADRKGAPPVVVVNAAFARQVFGGQALGRRLVLDQGTAEVVGVVRDMKLYSLNEKPTPAFYLPFAQEPGSRAATFFLATEGAPEPVLAQVRGIVRQVDPYLPVNELRTMESHLRFSLYTARTAALLLGTFGLLALVLAATGVYSVMAFDAAQRRREIGVRMALGAQILDVVRLILARGMRVVATGLGIGLAAAWGLSRLVSSLLYGIPATDPLTFAAITALLGGVALVACLVPALRAARTSPATALRHS